MGLWHSKGLRVWREAKVLRTSDVDDGPTSSGRTHRGGEGGGEPAPGLGSRRGVCGGEAVQHDLQRQRERRRHLGILQVENTCTMRFKKK